MMIFGLTGPSRPWGGSNMDTKRRPMPTIDPITGDLSLL